MSGNDDLVIYDIRNGKTKWTMVKPRTTAMHVNFLIICRWGDWSGFRRLGDCEKQIEELRKYTEENGERWYKIVERL